MLSLHVQQALIGVACDTEARKCVACSLYLFLALGICSSCRKNLRSDVRMKAVTIDDSPANKPLPLRQARRQIELFEDSVISEAASPGYQPIAKLAPRTATVTPPPGVEELNDLLKSRDYSPVRYRLRSDWSEASERTKREHLRKVEQGVQAVIHAIAPGQEEEVLKDLIRRMSREKRSRNEDESKCALFEAYRASEDKGTKLQILSIIVDLYKHGEIMDLLPDVTTYQLGKAKKHLLLHGRGQPVPVVKRYRTGVTMPKVEHFIEFLTNPNFVQDVAYGTRKLKLPTGETIIMPNVVTTSFHRE